MTDNELDRLMQQVLLDSLRLEWDREPEPKLPFVPTARYKGQILTMLADPLVWERKKSTPLWKKAARRIAVVLLIISIGFSSLLAASPTVRAVFLQWIIEWYETHITYRYTGSSTAEAMPQYEITELPEGYTEAEGERVELSDQVDIVYRNEETGKTIYLNYLRMCQGAASNFEFKKDIEVIPVKVHELDGLFFGGADLEDEWNKITWTDPDSGLHFLIGAQLEKAEILHIAESVYLAELTK